MQDPSSDNIVDALPGSEPESLPGTELEALPGLEPEALPRTELDALPGSEPEALPGTELDALPGSEPESLPGMELDALPGSEPESLPGTEPDARPKSRGLTWLIVGAAAAVILAVGVFLFLSRSPGKAADPRLYIREAFDNTFAALTAERARQTAIADISAILADGLIAPSRQTLSFRLNNFLFFGSPGLTIETQTDPSARQAKTDASLTLSGFPLGSFTVYLDNDLLSIAAPLLFEGEYGLHLETLGRDFNASPLSRSSGLSLADDLSIPVWRKGASFFIVPGWLTEAGRKLSDDIVVEKMDEQEVRVNDYLKTCETFEVKAGVEAVRRYIFALWEGIKGEQAFLEALSAIASELPPEEMLTQADTMLNSLANSLTGDVSILLFIHQGRLIRADFLLPLSIYKPDEYCLSIQIGGEKNLSDAFSVDFSGEKFGVSLKWAGRHLPSDGKYSTDLRLFTYSAEEDEPSIILSISGWYDPDLPEDNLAFLLDLAEGYDQAVQVSLNGTLLYDKAKKTLNADFSRAWFSLPGLTQGFSLDYERKPLSNPDLSGRNPTILFSMTMEEIQDLLDEAQSSINSLLSFGGLF